MKTIIIFDVETTGLFPKNICEAYPSIIQLSYILYDLDTNSVIETKNMYIRIPETTIITPFVTNLTGITRELLDEKGITISEAIMTFYETYKKADMMVAHNISFDLKMILVESQHICSELYKDIKNKRTFCTMKESVDICKLEHTNSKGVYFKFPKLSQLYEHYFGHVPENLHDAHVDVLCCLRCFLRMEFYDVISDEEFAVLLSV